MNLFIGIGAQKAGTTWVANYLEGHPQAFISPIKELHFLDSFFLPNSYVDFNKSLRKKLIKHCRNLSNENLNERKAILIEHLCKRVNMSQLEDYFSYFKYYSYSEKNKIVGEITPSYSLLKKEHFAEIILQEPNSKFFFILRNPIDRYWSALRFTKKSVPDFDPLRNFEKKLTTPAYYNRTDYKKTITELESVVPKENILYLFYEDLLLTDISIRVETLKKLTNFLGIQYVQPNFNEVSNKSTNLELMKKDRMKAVRHFSKVYSFCKKKFNRLPENWSQDIKEFLR